MVFNPQVLDLFSSSKSAGPNTVCPPSPTLEKSQLWLLQAVETHRIWKWISSEAMKMKFPPPVWNHSNQLFYGWSIAGEREKQSGLQKCEASQEVLCSLSPSLSYSCYFFWIIDSISSCNSSRSTKGWGSWICRQLAARSTSSVPLWSLL